MTAVQTLDRARIMSWFNRIVITAIIATYIIAVLGMIGPDIEDALEPIDMGILVFFGFELAVRIKLAGHGWWRDPWLWADVMILTLALLPLGANITALRIMRLFRLLHAGRHLPHLTHLPALRWLPALLRRAVTRPAHASGV